MISADPQSWFLILFTFSVVGIAIYIIHSYSKRFCDLKDTVHTIHAFIQLIDESIEDDSISKEEFVALVKRCLAVLAKLY
jgi:hypothetical protein